MQIKRPLIILSVLMMMAVGHIVLTPAAYALSVPAFPNTVTGVPQSSSCNQSTSGTGADWSNPGNLAQDPACLSDPRQAMSLTGPLISWAIGLLLIGGAIGAIAMFVFGAYKYMMSEGDPGKTAEARKTIQYAVAGLLITGIVYLFIIFYNNIIPSG